MSNSRTRNLRVVNPVLTNMARGYTNEEYIGAQLLPFAPMEKEGGTIPTFGKEAFRLRQTERAIRARSNRINPEDRGTVDVVLKEHDLEYPIDYREAGESIWNEQQHGTMVTMEGIRLRHEGQVAQLVQDTNTYGADNRETLTGGDKFSDYDSSDPIALVEEAKETIRSKIVRYPNTMWMGASVFAKLKEHPKLLERIKYSQRAVLTIDLMREIFGVERILVGRAVYADNQDSFHDVWGKNLGLSFVNPGGPRGPNYRDPSFGYTMHRTGYPQTDTYDENGGKISIVRSTDFFEPKILGPDAGYLFADAVE